MNLYHTLFEAFSFTIVGFATGYCVNELKHLLIKYMEISKEEKRGKRVCRISKTY